MLLDSEQFFTMQDKSVMADIYVTQKYEICCLLQLEEDNEFMYQMKKRNTIYDLRWKPQPHNSDMLENNKSK